MRLSCALNATAPPIHGNDASPASCASRSSVGTRSMRDSSSAPAASKSERSPRTGTCAISSIGGEPVLEGAHAAPTMTTRPPGETRPSSRAFAAEIPDPAAAGRDGAPRLHERPARWRRSSRRHGSVRCARHPRAGMRSSMSSISCALARAARRRSAHCFARAAKPRRSSPSSMVNPGHVQPCRAPCAAKTEKNTAS